MVLDPLCPLRNYSIRRSISVQTGAVFLQRWFSSRRIDRLLHVHSSHEQLNIIMVYNNTNCHYFFFCIFFFWPFKALLIGQLKI